MIAPDTIVRMIENLTPAQTAMLNRLSADETMNRQWAAVLDAHRQFITHERSMPDADDPNVTDFLTTYNEWYTATDTKRDSMVQCQDNLLMTMGGIIFATEANEKPLTELAPEMATVMTAYMFRRCNQEPDGTVLYPQIVATTTTAVRSRMAKKLGL